MCPSVLPVVNHTAVLPNDAFSANCSPRDDRLQREGHKRFPTACAQGGGPASTLPPWLRDSPPIAPVQSRRASHLWFGLVACVDAITDLRPPRPT